MTGLMVSMLAFVAGVKDKLESEKGATATEYSLLVAFIAFAIIVAVGFLGTELNGLFDEVLTSLEGAGGAA